MRKTISQRVSVGEQPQKADLEELKKDGVTTVVNLRVVGEETPLTPAEERALAEQLGLQYHHLPISLDKLNAAQVKELREILENSKGQVFVHCGLGQRACSFSLAASGVSSDSIFEQARKLGFPVQDEKLRVFLKSLKD
jgi:sulfide:quinone oxidoreductase